MNRLAFAFTVGTLSLLGACNSPAEGVDPGPVTQEEAEALEDAASMLEEQRLPDEPGDTEGETQ